MRNREQRRPRRDFLGDVLVSVPSGCVVRRLGYGDAYGHHVLEGPLMDWVVLWVGLHGLILLVAVVRRVIAMITGA